MNSIRKNRRILAAMSGGVDSSVTALRLVREGYDVAGVMMKLFGGEHSPAETSGGGAASGERTDAEKTADALGIPFFMLNLTERFRECVIAKFAAEYEAGRTPNPCVECNRYMKFGILLQKADELGCEYIATGHYARVERGPGGRYLLKRAADSAKDQSYVLHTLKQDVLSRVIFPLGDLTKTEVREAARSAGLPNPDKPESQDICFIPDGDYAGFLERYAGEPAVPGDFISADGQVLGRHTGLRNYTVGQRRGLGVSSGGRLYVARIDTENNTVTLDSGAALYTKKLTARGVNIIPADRLEGEVRCEVKIRYAHKPQSAAVRQTDETSVEIVFDEPQRAVTPGQYAVMYDGDIVLGGGVIC